MFGIITAIAASALILGPAVWLTIKSMREDKSQSAYRRDLSHVNENNVCASCGGYATEVLLDTRRGILMCKDRNLCRSTLIWRSMLESQA